LITAVRLRVSVATLLVLGLILTWQLAFQSSSERSIAADNEDRIDWFVNQGLLTRFNEEGLRISATDAQRIIHYDRRREIELSQPYSVGFNQDQSVTHTLSAQRAVYQDDNSQLELAQQVELHHNPETDQSVAMFTPTLTYYPQTGLAVTQDPVEITSNTGVTRAIGMEFYTTESRMELLSTVRGNYVATENR